MQKQEEVVTRVGRTRQRSGLKELSRLAFEELRRKHPSVPVGALVVYKYTDRTANGLTRCIIDFLRLSGHQAERISVTGRPIDSRKIVTDVLGHSRVVGSLTWIPGTMTKGSADISAVVRGISVKIEVKIDQDRQSPAQSAYQASVEKSGGVYYIARDFQGFLEWFKEKF